jgi:hypothetical protein
MPFGMFIGVNNHFQSVLFAGVLMRDETSKSFAWVFKEFITLMGGKAPITILTGIPQVLFLCFITHYYHAYNGNSHLS